MTRLLKKTKGGDEPKILDPKSVQERFAKTTMFYPISKILLDKFKPSTDIINTFEASVDHLEDILSTQSILDEFIDTNIKGVSVKIKYWVDNLQFFSPDSEEFITRSIKYCNPRSPNEAFEKRKTYTMLITGDCHCIYKIFNVEKEIEYQAKRIDLENAYAVNLPIPLGCKYDSMYKLDPLTLQRTGECMEGALGYFIIGGFPKYLNTILKKPFNQPMIQHNEFDGQKSRMECLYSAGMDYENSYYVIASLLQPKMSARGAKKIPIPDFVFSLQMDDTRMNKERIVSRKKVLINKVPIRYMFYAFGCENDEEMIKYICPDMDNFGLIKAIHRSYMYGNEHIKVLDGILPYKLTYGFLQIDEPLNIISARYLIGEIILSEEYKKKIKEDIKRQSKKGDKDAELREHAKYRAQIVNDVDKILREKFMPGINRLNSDMSLYTKDDLTDEEILKLQKQEKERNKAICFELGYIVRSLYNIGYDIQPSMDKVSLLNRRVRSGQQIEYEYKGFNNARVREIKSDISQFFRTINDESHFKEKRFEDAFKNVLESAIKKTNDGQSASLLNSFKGVVTKEKSKLRTQLANLKNQVFMDAMLREIVIGADRGLQSGHDDVQWEHRVVHPSHLFFIDPCYTPEGGKSVGKNQQPTLYTYLSNGDLGKSVYEYIKKMPQYKTYVDTINQNYIIKLNGSSIGYVEEFEPVEKMYEDLMEARRKKEIIRDCSITMKHSEGILEIWTDEGRMMNHFVDVKKCFDILPMSDKTYKDSKNAPEQFYTDAVISVKKEFMEWIQKCHDCDLKLVQKGENGLIQPISEILYEEGLDKGFLTLVDPTMAVYNGVIAQTMDAFYHHPYNYNYITLPEQLLSYVSAINPSVALNAGVRTSYCSNHVKQAIGPTLRYPEMKYINEMNVLCSPQIPLVRPAIYDYLHYDDKPMGNNIIIAFLMNTDNQEDSFILNRSSVENGVLCIDSIFTYFANTEKKLDESFKLPGDDIRKSGNSKAYQKLNAKSCLPQRVGMRFYNGDPLIAKVVTINQNGQNITADKSVLNEKPDAFHPREACTRELVYAFNNENINENTSEKMAVFKQTRVPIPGDKFNSTNAQKGTLGKIYDTKNMPYTDSGVVPDIIFNPPSVFKRNTCGQAYEPQVSKLASLLCCPLETAPYCSYRSTEEIDEIYKELGLDVMGYENLYEPDSGRLIGKVFLATLQQQRQQHLVENKLNVRGGAGDCDKVSGLPVKGRKKAGGQSVDRMSNDAINTSGAVLLNKFIHIEQGAKTLVAWCNKCHAQFTYYSTDFKCWFCAKCGRHQEFTIIEVPPIQPLINQIFNALHYRVELREKNDEENSGILSTIETKYYTE